MTLLIPLLLRLTTLFERGKPMDEAFPGEPAAPEESLSIPPEKE